MNENENLVPKRRFKEFTNTGTWEQRKLGDVTTKIGSGKTPRGGSSVYGQSGVPLIRSQNIYNDRVNLEDVVYIEESMDNEMANSRVEKRDILLNITGASIGRSAVYEVVTPANVNQHVCIIRPKHEIDSYYIQLNLTSPDGQKQIDLNQAGGAREGLNFQQIAKMTFSFPSFREQNKIGELFRQLDDTIALHQRKLEKSKALKSAYLSEMFPVEGERKPKRRFAGFTDDWEQRKLKELTEVITKGTTPKDKSGKGSINFVKVENINKSSGEIDIKSKITENEHEGYLKRSQLKDGDILFSIAGTLGRTAIVKKELLPANTNQALAIIRLDEGDKNYITTFLNGRAAEDFIKKNPTVGAQPNLSLEQVGNLLIEIPSLEEQTKIGSFFKQLDDTIALHQHKLEKLQNIKQAYLNEMFV